MALSAGRGARSDGRRRWTATNCCADQCFGSMTPTRRSRRDGCRTVGAGSETMRRRLGSGSQLCCGGTSLAHAAPASIWSPPMAHPPSNARLSPRARMLCLQRRIGLSHAAGSPPAGGSAETRSRTDPPVLELVPGSRGGAAHVADHAARQLQDGAGSRLRWGWNLPRQAERSCRVGNQRRRGRRDPAHGRMGCRDHGGGAGRRSARRQPRRPVGRSLNNHRHVRGAGGVRAG
jgi:hypothetical protein